MSEVWVYSNNWEYYPNLLAGGRSVADELGVKLAAVLISGKLEDKQIESQFKFSADKVYAVTLEGEENPDSILYSLNNLATEYNPSVIIMPATRFCKEIAPRLAVKLDGGCSSEASALETSEGFLQVSRVTYGGSTLAKIRFKRKPQIVTVQPHAFAPMEAEKTGEVVRVTHKPEEMKVKVIEVKPKAAEGPSLTEAEVIVAGGRGIKNKDDFKMLQELAEVLGGVVGCTRPIAADRKWYPEWIGLSGVKVAPKLYIAAGISGAIQHIAGIRDSKIIVAVNKDEEAPITSAADYYYIGDLYKFIPAFTEALKKALKG